MGKNYYDGDECELADALVDMGRGPFRWIGDIKDANARAGNHYFEASTMRFFDSRVAEVVEYGRVFITSERFDYNSARLYTIRIANDDGTIWVDYPALGVLTFQRYESLSVARRVARNAAELAAKRQAVTA